MQSILCDRNIHLLKNKLLNNLNQHSIKIDNTYFVDEFNWLPFRHQWLEIQKKAYLLYFSLSPFPIYQASVLSSQNLHILQFDFLDFETIEALEVEWLMTVFNTLFKSYRVKLVKGGFEPEYIPANIQEPAHIYFANGYFASALHELSHWCIAGKKRRLVRDYGYWYIPDGRNDIQQKEFEKVEIKPQAIECLFSLVCNKPFKVSIDNLNSGISSSSQMFEHNVYALIQTYIETPNLLPPDAKILLHSLAKLCHDL